MIAMQLMALPLVTQAFPPDASPAFEDTLLASISAEYTLHSRFYVSSKSHLSKSGDTTSGVHVVYAGVKTVFPSPPTLHFVSGRHPIGNTTGMAGELGGVIGIRCGEIILQQTSHYQHSTSQQFPWHLLPLPNRLAQHEDDIHWETENQLSTSSMRLMKKMQSSIVGLKGNKMGNATDYALNAMLVLRYHDSNGIIATNPVLGRGNSGGANSGSGPPLASCKLVFPRCSDQHYWPAKFLTVEESGAGIINLAGTEYSPIADSHSKTNAGSIRRRSPVVLNLSPHISPSTSFSQTSSESGGLGPSWAYGNMPGLGNTDMHLSRYCNVQSLKPRQLRALRAAHETALIETGSSILDSEQGSAGIPGLKTIIEFTTKLVLAPLMEPAVRMMTGALSSELGKETGPEMNSDIPNEVVAQLTPTIAFNVGNLLPDALAFRVGKDSAREILKMKERKMTWDIHSKIMKDLPSRIARQLGRTLPSHLYKRLPRLLERSLPGMLVGELTGTVTHSLVPALAAVIGRSSAARSELEYVSTYYADYYTPYFRTYYSNVYRVKGQPVKGN